MTTKKINNVLFKGQYAEAVNSMLSGNNVTLRDFNNGKWEATSQVSRFLTLLKNANVSYNNKGNGSLRSINLSI